MRRALAQTYLVLALSCGGVMAFLNPPFQSPDEPNHFYRALTISQGYLLATRKGDVVGAPVSLAVSDWIFALLDDIPFHPEKKQSLEMLRAWRDPIGYELPMGFPDFRNSALYSPVAYLPQALGLGLGRLLRLPLLDSYYLARLLNLLTCVALCYWACLRLPYGRLTFVLIALSPLFLFQQASLSADGLSYALASSFAASVLAASRMSRPAAPTTREVVGLSVLGALALLCKPSSAPLPLLALLLLAGGGSPIRRPWREVLTVSAVSWAALLAWSLAVSGLYIPAHLGVPVEPAAQLAHVLAHPLEFVGTLWRTLAMDSYMLSLSAVGVLGWLDTPLSPAYVTYFYGALIASGLVAESSLLHASWRERGLAALVILSTYVLLALISYLTWSMVGASRIDGLMGRYFLHLAVPWAVLLQWPAWVQARIGPRLRLSITTGCLLYSVFFIGHAFQTMLRRYWS